MGLIAQPLPFLYTKQEPVGTYVGQLQERWQFPSDHLPIGMSMDDIHIVSWNVLDAAYMVWVTERNSQGLSRSLIADEHVYIEGSLLTVRDKHVVDLILQMISHPLKPRTILALQECGNPFLEELKSRLPAHFIVIAYNGNAILLDSHLFKVVSQKPITSIFPQSLDTSFLDIVVKHQGKNLRLINVHIPGNPRHGARFAFANYLHTSFTPNTTTLALGDMNFNELEMKEALTLAFGTSPFTIYSPYCTNISPGVFFSKAIDHFLLYATDKPTIALNTPDEVLDGLHQVAELLTGKNTTKDKQAPSV